MNNAVNNLYLTLCITVRARVDNSTVPSHSVKWLLSVLRTKFIGRT